MTDKVDTEIGSPTSSVMTEIRIGEDIIAAVGAVIAIIRDGAEGNAKFEHGFFDLVTVRV